jgi:BlaI family transcriptional regulator, penicillinase repressor
MSKPGSEIAESEWAILKVLWEREPCTAPDVTEALQETKGWAYSTVRTTMDRMVAKGLLTSEKIRHMDLYRSAVSRKQAQRGELLATLKRAFDGALTPMVQCLLESRGLSAEELRALEAMLKEERAEAGKTRGAQKQTKGTRNR